MGLPTELPDPPPAKTPLKSARNGYEYYKCLQTHDGHWPGEYGGPMFLIPGLNVGSYITGIPFTDRQERYEMIRYPMNHADEARGWGMPIEWTGQSKVDLYAPHFVLSDDLNVILAQMVHGRKKRMRGCLIERLQSHLNFKFSFTIWTLDKADSYLGRLGTEKKTSGRFASGH